jgi:hypothetical protein
MIYVLCYGTGAYDDYVDHQEPVEFAGSKEELMEEIHTKTKESLDTFECKGFLSDYQFKLGSRSGDFSYCDFWDQYENPPFQPPTILTLDEWVEGSFTP